MNSSKVVHSDYQPSLRTLMVVLAVVATIVAVGTVVNQLLLASIVTMLICVAVMAFWVVRNGGVRKRSS